jgi:hypothetical protein
MIRAKSHGPIERMSRRQLASHAMREPAPDLIRGRRRFATRICANQNDRTPQQRRAS